MIKKIFSYTLVEGVSKGLNKALIILIPLILTTSDFGKIGIIISIEIILPILMLLGLDKSILRFYDNNNKTKIIGTSLSTVTFTFLLLSFIVFIFSFFNSNFFSLKYFPDLYFLIIVLYIQCLNYLFISIFRANESHKKYFSLKIISSISKLFFVVFFLIILKNYFAYIIGVGLSSFLVFCYCLKSSNFTPYFFKFDKSFFLRAIIFGLPIVFHGISLNLLSHGAKFIIEDMIDLKMVGVYTLALAIGSSVTFAFQGISSFMEPLIYKEDNYAKRLLLLNKYFFFCMFGGIFLGLALVYLVAPFLNFYYSNQYLEVIELFPYIILSFIIMPYYLMCNYELIYQERTISIALTTTFSALLNVSLNYLFIGFYGIFGSILALFFTYFTQSLILTYLKNNKVFEMQFFEIFIVGCSIFSGIYFKIDFIFLIIGLLFFYSLKYFKLNPKSTSV